MNHKTKVNTSSTLEQAKNATLTLLQINAVCQQLGDIEEQAQAAHTLTEICFEELDRAGAAITDHAGNSAVLRLDALMKSIFRNVTLIQASVDAIGDALLPVPGVAA